MTPDWYMVFSAFVVGFWAGLWAGSYLEAIQWRRKGDHDYMNRKESGGKLYNVKAEKRPMASYQKREPLDRNV